MNRRLGSLLPGVIVVAIGVWLLARNLNAPLPDIGALWPALLLLFGAASIANYFGRGRRDSGQVFLGVAAALLGAFFFMFTLGTWQWADMDRYWPVFVLIGSLAFLAQWAVEPARRGLLVPAAIALAVGVLFLPSTLGLVNPALADRITQFWPAVLIVVGVGVLFSSISRSGSSRG